MSHQKMLFVPSAVQTGFTRRAWLIGLAAMAPAAAMLDSVYAAQSPSENGFLMVSKVITGSNSLSPDIAARIEKLLQSRSPSFSAELEALAQSMKKSGGDRASMLSGLDDKQTALALVIAGPWYLGYVGSPSDFVLKDDAAFATYMQAQSWEKIVDEVPRPTYPTGGVGWWSAAPPNVVAPEMPAEILDWTFNPQGPSTIMPPDAQWLAYATQKHESIDAARLAKPGNATGADKK